MTHPRLIDQLFCNPEFLIDQESIPAIIRDIINMNWWNTCGYLRGYRANARVYADSMPRDKVACALSLFEWYYVRNERLCDERAFRREIRDYIAGSSSEAAPKQLRLWSSPYRRNPSQYYWKDGKPTWITCTSRAKYSFIILAQNGYFDFDGVCRFEDAEKVLEFRDKKYIHDLGAKFEQGENKVKSEIFSQRNVQTTVKEWVERLGVSVLAERRWLFDAVSHVRSDPYKRREAEMIRQGLARGVNELLYVDIGRGTKKTFDKPSQASGASHASNASGASGASRASNASTASRASRASNASHESSASRASRASNASSASDASRASHASGASHASRASQMQNSSEKHRIGPGSLWRESLNAYGDIPGLDYPPEFRANKFGIAGHWKIESSILNGKKSWFDCFSGWGHSPLMAARYGIRYHGIELNPDAMTGYILPIILDEIKKTNLGSKISLEIGDSRDFRPELVGQFDLCYTSPPYFDFEEYGGHSPALQMESWNEFHEKLTKPVFRNVRQYLTNDGVLALQIGCSGKELKAWLVAIEDCGFRHVNHVRAGNKQDHSVHVRSWQNVLLFERSDRIESAIESPGMPASEASAVDSRQMALFF